MKTKTALMSEFFTKSGNKEYILSEVSPSFIRCELDRYNGKNKKQIVEKYFSPEYHLTVTDEYEIISLDDYGDFIFYS